MKDIKKSITKRFLEVFNELKKRKLLRNKSAMAKRLDTYNHVINNILNGHRQPTIRQLHLLGLHYGIDINYIIGTSDKMFLFEENTKPSNKTLNAKKR